MAESPGQESWHLDKKVPIALIIAMLGQFGGFIWFAAKLDGRIDQQAQRIAQIEASDKAQDLKIGSTSDGVIRLQEQMNYLIRMVDRLVEQAARPAPPAKP